jgi:uncharacterized membrane protein
MAAFHELHMQLKVLALTVAGLMIIVGFRRQGIKLLASTIVMALLFPFLLATINQLPLWAVAAILLVTCMVMLKRMVGNEAWGQFIGSVMFDLLWRFPLRLASGFGRQILKLFGRRS